MHLWSQSLSKEFLEFKDREDHGCKHEFSRTVKTIVQRRQRSLPWTLTLENRLYPLRKETRPRLGVLRRVKHLIKFLEALRIYMERRNLSHYCLTDANLNLWMIKGRVGQGDGKSFEKDSGKRRKAKKNYWVASATLFYSRQKRYLLFCLTPAEHWAF